MKHKNENILFGTEQFRMEHDPVPSDNKRYYREISLLWGLIKIKT